MIIALTALALAMILGGLLTAFLGWDIVLVERGWTMVIAGTISAASGALLLGITAAVSRLGRIQSDLARVRGDLVANTPGEGRATSADLSSSALSSGFLGGRAHSRADAQEAEEEVEQLPLFDEIDEGRDVRAVDASERFEAARSSESVIPFARRPVAETEPSRDEDAPEIKVPDFLLANRNQDADEEDRIADADKSPSTAEVSKDKKGTGEGEEDVTPAAWPTTAAEPEPESVAEPEPEAAPEEPRPATIIGTYNSGDNKYVMFSDGSIEAQTPGGVFHFKSLDELKEFIASGGESGAAGST